VHKDLVLFLQIQSLFVDRLTKEQRRKNMQAVKSSGSKIETVLAKLLYSKGYRYRKNDKTVFGKPDLTFKKLKIAVFVDSEFWHGKNWDERKNDHKSNREFWHKKIERNIERDKEVNNILSEKGWIILRFWGSDIKKDLLNCAIQVETAIKEAKDGIERKNIAGRY
jgi:DNA mismatch endonuclease Vsr